ncbi:PREDICTED: bromodomain adjacent to zinc finger domain protein 2B-like [Camelina sativa]|uniref:Bromodomain adjacent to zinc finger domain protein 2B-like n=1 Tax=Camelina sativa TaxID=90675 RepID=A0ABM0VBC1_CAMSA|nr:PREDICTED: bromodomain adjacent to zinc finger domain protein 2B-like [Camelina sativa]
MAEETVRLPISPDVNRSWRRISTGKLSFLYSEEKVLPNYLRSPTGSCHDACKYGRKHESQDKPRVSSSPLQRVDRSYSGTPSFDSPVRKKALMTKSVLSSSFGSGICDFGGSDHTKSEVERFSSRVCDDVKKNDARTTYEEVVLAKGKKKKKNKMVFVTRGRAISRSKEMVEHNRRVTALKLKSVAQTAAIALRRSTVKRKKMNGGSKAAEPKKAVVPFRVSVMSSKRCSRCCKTKKESSSLRVPLVKTRKHVDKKCKDLVEEKTLYVIKMETGDEIVETDQNQRCVMDSPPTDDPKSQDEADCIESEADDDESSQEEDDDDNENMMSFSEANNITRQGKSTALSAESAKEERLKQRVKRGKIVDLRSQGNNSPRKLKFKRGRVVAGADTNSKSGSRRRLKTKGTNLSNDKEQQQQQQQKPTVVLKHQETDNKRDSRVLLYNNVIEETANKLAQTRKSKVKALVGAFESVISLQEKTSSPTT